MTPAQQSLVAVAASSAVPLIGTFLFAAGARRFLGLVPHVIPFAVGAIVGAALFHLIPDAAGGSFFGPRAGHAAAVVIAGILAFALLDLLTHRRTHGVEASSGRSAARAVLAMSIVSDALHNLIDGVLVATTFLNEPTVGVITAIAVATHEIPRELGTFALCISGGLSIRSALLFNAGTAALALVGALGAISLGATATQLATDLLPFAAGAFLYLAVSIVWRDREQWRSTAYRVQYAALALFGLIVAGAARH